MNLRISNENFSQFSPLARASLFSFRNIRMESAHRSFYKLETKRVLDTQEDYILSTVLHGIYKQIGFIMEYVCWHLDLGWLLVLFFAFFVILQ